MIPRIRPYFEDSFIEFMRKFNHDVPREEYIVRISEKFRSFFPSTKKILFLSEGRKALLAALSILEVKKGDEIILPCFTCNSVLDPVIALELKPILIDLDLDLDMDMKGVKEHITDKTKAMVVTHYFGIPSNIFEVKELADEWNIPIIEDCAQFFCSNGKNLRIGNIGDMAFTSHKPDKPLSIGKGGCLLLNRADLISRAETFHGNLDLNPLYEEKCAFLNLLFYFLETHESVYRNFIGVYDFYNYMLTHPSVVENYFDCLIKADSGNLDTVPIFSLPKAHGESIKQGLQNIWGCIKRKEGNPFRDQSHPFLMNTLFLGLLENALTHLDAANVKRKENGRIYQEYLQESSNIITPADGKKAAFLRYPIIGGDRRTTMKIIKNLESWGCEAGNFNWPFTLNKILKISENFPKSEFIAQNIINLPSHPYIKRGDLIDICEIINKI